MNIKTRCLLVRLSRSGVPDHYLRRPQCENGEVEVQQKAIVSSRGTDRAAKPWLRSALHEVSIGGPSHSFTCTYRLIFTIFNHREQEWLTLNPSSTLTLEYASWLPRPIAPPPALLPIRTLHPCPTPTSAPPYPSSPTSLPPNAGNLPSPPQSPPRAAHTLYDRPPSHPKNLPLTPVEPAAPASKATSPA